VVKFSPFRLVLIFNYIFLNAKEKKLYIYELIDKNELYLPKYEPPKKSEDYEAKIQSLRARLDEEAYQRMVYNVDLNSPLRNFSGEQKKTGMVPECKQKFK